MENIRDWCISRQIWWGHRIPVWYYTDANGQIDESRGFVVAVDQPEPGMVQDEDVLDTWFSSWLWPFATLGWPEKTPELAYFYPTTVLVSGYDILFFWIARMIMAGLHFTGQVPFRDVFITGMVKDKYGRWMSKSLGNGIDPLEMIEQYGADAVRYSLTVLCTQGQDIKLDPSKFEMGRNFANKIWNAFNVFGQFMETDEEGRPLRDYRRKRRFEELSLVERWMVSRLNQALGVINEAIDRYRLNEALLTLYDIFWGDYCDWYLELIKPPRGQAMDEETIALAVELYEKMIQLLHPFMPFITEALWWRLRPRAEREACITSRWPEVNPHEVDEVAVRRFQRLQEMISGVRNVRSTYGVAPGSEIRVLIRVPEAEASEVAQLEAHRNYFIRLAKAREVTVGVGLERPKASAVVVVGRYEVYVPLADVIDLAQERARLEKEIQQKERFLLSLQQKLQNTQFLEKAPAEVVARERQKAQDVQAELERLRANLAVLD
jgi:valyl-tRNA synthetase